MLRKAVSKAMLKYWSVQHTKAVSNSEKLVFKYQQHILQNGKIVELGNTWIQWFKKRGSMSSQDEGTVASTNKAIIFFSSTKSYKSVSACQFFDIFSLLMDINKVKQTMG
jgi:hypothetical protein